MAMDFKYDKIEDVDESCIVGYKGIYNKYVKRIIDLILSVLLFVILSPVFVIISVAIIIDSGFPVFYRAERGGYKNKTFKIFKFRVFLNKLNPKKDGRCNDDNNDNNNDNCFISN